jgi:hypothetical protein
MEQLQALADLISGTVRVNLKAPQWQLPWYVLSSSAGAEAASDMMVDMVMVRERNGWYLEG